MTLRAVHIAMNDVALYIVSPNKRTKYGFCLTIKFYCTAFETYASKDPYQVYKDSSENALQHERPSRLSAVHI